MAIVQISKIIHRTGANEDLPQLDIGELGYATDDRRLYIGDDTILHPAGDYPTSRTEVLTDACIGVQVPTSKTAPGDKGQIAYDATHMYVCVAKNTWIRIASSSTW